MNLSPLSSLSESLAILGQLDTTTLLIIITVLFVGAAVVRPRTLVLGFSFLTVTSADTALAVG
jgi:hypothetical protein